MNTINKQKGLQSEYAYLAQGMYWLRSQSLYPTGWCAEGSASRTRWEQSESCSALRSQTAVE